MGAPVQVAQLQQESQQALQIPPQTDKPQWSFAQRAAFRFCFVYFGLFCIATQILGSLIPIPNVDIPDLSSLWPMRQITFWTKSSDKNWKGNLNFQRVAQDQLILDGSMDGHKIHMQLHLVDRSKFMLVSRGFHWVQEYPFNR
jgi:hypothetical protein